jgi:Pyruvate/2-oxoacid:ferredoxin oxidoreductase delta subunit
MEIYEQVADMIIEEDVVPPPKTPAFLKILSLQLTRAEATLALQVRTTGGTLGELAERTGIKPARLKKMLLKMADKGTIYYGDGDDPVYRMVKTAAPGFTESGLWGGIREPYTVELGKALNQMVKEWASETLAKLGFAFAPVWAAVDALPEGADPTHNLAEAIKDAGHWSVASCPCRLSHWLTDPGNHCDHMLESCIITGEESRWAVRHGMARELSYDGVVARLKECNQNGLVHTLNIQGNICNCCNDCCGIFEADASCDGCFIPSPYLAQLDDEDCNGCSSCAERCPVNAIEVDQAEKSAFLQQDRCFGCGICVTTCELNCFSLANRPAAAA